MRLAACGLVFTFWDHDFHAASQSSQIRIGQSAIRKMLKNQKIFKFFKMSKVDFCINFEHFLTFCGLRIAQSGFQRIACGLKVMISEGKNQSACRKPHANPIISKNALESENFRIGSRIGLPKFSIEMVIKYFSHFIKLMKIPLPATWPLICLL